MMKVRLFVPVLMLCFSCTDSKVDTSKIQEEMKAREVKVVPEGKIVERTFHLGDSLLTSLSITDATDLTGGPYKSWQLMNDVKAECSLYFISESYELTGKEKQVFEAYQYSAENQQPADPNVQKLENAQMLYSAPFMQNGAVKGMWSVKLPRKYVILSMPE